MTEKCSQIVWVAWMARWGNAVPTHAYAVGVFDDEAIAKRVADEEALHRGGKYEYQFAACTIDMERGPTSLRAERELPRSVYVCSVTHPGLGSYDSRQHLVGVFTTEALARGACRLLYPGWEIKTSQWLVERHVNSPSTVDKMMYGIERRDTA